MAFKERIFRRSRGDESAVQPGDPAATLAADDASQPTPDAAAAGQADAPQDAAADAAHADADGQTVVMPAVDPSPVPLGEPVVAQRRAGFRERGRMRRRLRYLREVRELGYRDLGGLVFDQHRFGRPNEALVQGKVNAIDAIDRESRALGAALEEHSAYSELRVAGVSACQRCGGLHGSDARFCPSCGLAFAGPRTVAGVWAEHPAPAPDPTHAGYAGGQAAYVGAPEAPATLESAAAPVEHPSAPAEHATPAGHAAPAEHAAAPEHAAAAPEPAPADPAP